MRKSLEMIKRHEGIELKPYRDSLGILTIGVGHNLENGLSEKIIDLIFEEDMETVIEDCNKFDWYAGLNKARQAVIENMVFNLGYGRFNGFKKTIELISNNQFNHAAEEMLNSKWARQVGNRAIELSQIMRSGSF